jgi:creatinine amidohydrolase
MTWDEVAARLADGTDTVIVPFGSTEPHGFHCPMGMDSISVDTVLRRAADKLECFYAPVMPYGMSANHMNFKGTLTLSPLTMSTVVKELCECLAQHGFRHVILATGHGENFPAMRVGAWEAKRTCDVMIGICNYYVAVKKYAAEILGLPPRSVNARDYRSHGGTLEVSLALFETPRDVKMDRFAFHDAGPILDNEESTTTVVADLDEYSPSGNFGRGDLASPEVGERIIEIASDAVRDDVRSAIARYGKRRVAQGQHRR